MIERLEVGPEAGADALGPAALLASIRSRKAAEDQAAADVLDLAALNQEKSAPGYGIPDRIRDHVALRDRARVFPWCGRPARGCDVDHVTEYDHDADAEGRPQPGPTWSENLASR